MPDEWSEPMALDLETDPVFLQVVDGLPNIAEFITSLPEEKRMRALEAAEQSYVKTACERGYDEADARVWAAAVMFRLRVESLSAEPAAH